jgi:hypothetical protein
MTVYFLKVIGDDSKVKIGYTADLYARLQAISSQFEHGIELLAICEGDVNTERAFHFMFEESRLGGEWFQRSSAIDNAISVFAPNLTGKRIWARLKPSELGKISPIDEDRELAYELLSELMGKFGAIPFGIAQTKAFEELKSLNSLWTHRRVRAIWERKARRIDHFEIKDLKSLLSAYVNSSYQVANHD